MGAADARCSVSQETESEEFRQGPGLLAIAASADAIIIAKIVRVRSDAFDARVLERLHGDAGESSEIAVNFSTFETTEPRWAPYEAGQKLVLFIERDPANETRWQISGTSGEGELPVDDRFVYLTGHFVDGLPVAKYQTLGAEIASQRVALGHFVDALKGLFECFNLERAGSPEPLCDPATLSDYSERSPLHRYFAKAAAGS